MTIERKPGRPVTNRIVNTIDAPGEKIAAAICVAADGKIRQSSGAARPPSGQQSAASRALAFRRGPERGASSA